MGISQGLFAIYLFEKIMLPVFSKGDETNQLNADSVDRRTKIYCDIAQ